MRLFFFAARQRVYESTNVHLGVVDTYLTLYLPPFLSLYDWMMREKCHPTSSILHSRQHGGVKDRATCAVLASEIPEEHSKQ